MDNRAALLQAALELFAERGYDAVGVQEIVERVGVTKPTLYHYFGSKGGLLEALLRSYFDMLIWRVDASAAYNGDLTGNLQQIAGVYFDFARANPIFYRMQLSMAFAPINSETYRLISGWSRQQEAILTKLFSQAVERHGNMRGRQQAYAYSFLGLLNTYISLWLIEQITLDDDIYHRIVHQFEHGIYS